MATFQMEKRQQQQQQQQQQQKQTNLKQRQRQQHTDPAADVSHPPAAQDEQHRHGTFTNCNRLWPTTCSTAASVATVDCSSCQRALIMLSMLVVVIVVISGNGVLAAQRDSYKSKDVGSSNNAIPSEGDAPAAVAGNGNGNGNGVGGSGSQASTTSSSGSNKNAPGPGQSMTTDSGSKYSSNAKSNSNANTNTNSNTNSNSNVTTTTTTTNGIASSSLHRGNSIASLAAAASINRNSIDLGEDSRSNGPYFDKAASKNVTALLGKTAYLNCRVKNLGNKTMLLQVSWVRHRDIHLLTVGRYTYTSDQRFRAIHQPQTEDWMLQIKYPQHRDSGIYECQVSTTPHMSHYIHLTVVEPSTEIIGAPDLYIESGSTINLTCVILNSPEPPAYIFWNHNNAIINYDSPRGGVSVVTNKGETTTSFLLIKSARPSDSGHYQCNPSNAKPKSVTVHVLNGEFPAAMQHAAPAHPPMSPSRYLLVYLFVCCCSLAFAGRSMRPSAVPQRQRRRRCSDDAPPVGAQAGAPTGDRGEGVGVLQSKRICRYVELETYSNVF
ncbi:probable serine/threonine-protein kinase MARK-A isoform X2 [Drosophila navojoa]|nr:probable serine/threonine-protein kinase MARK-A isoform X2 [Drosophila navojoa]